MQNSILSKKNLFTKCDELCNKTENEFYISNHEITLPERIYEILDMERQLGLLISKERELLVVLAVVVP